MTNASFPNRSTIKKLLFLILISLLLSGCAKLVSTEQPTATDWATLSAQQTVGQTFVAKYNGLTGIYFFLSPQENGNGEIKLHLKAAPQAVSDLAVSLNTLEIDAVKAPGYYGFFVPAQGASNQEYYYASLEVSGDGEVQIGKAPGETYLNGALYQNGMPEDSQAAFQLSYSRRSAILGLGREAVTWAGILAVAFFLFILPGWGLLSLLWHDWKEIRWPEKLGLSAGLSLAIYPLLLLWTNIIGLHLGAIYAWLPPLAGLGFILWRNWKQLAIRKAPRVRALRLSWADVAFIGVVTLIVLTRFWAIRSLDLPMWGDSYQHTMIAQLLVENNGLFTSWHPYAELTTFTYHFGFHSIVAVFNWITHLDMPKATLWVGQLLNILAVIALYPLATKIGRNQWAGVLAVLVAGLLSPMPMFYVNWGRYTQLAGQVILPAVVWLIWNTIAPKPSPDGRRGSKGTLIICCIALGGLALTHYRVLIFALTFLAILWIVYARRKTIRLILLQTFWIGIGSGLLFLPWFIRVFGGRISQIFVNRITTSAATVVEANPQISNVGNISLYLPIAIWLILPVVIGIGLWRREVGFILICLWWFANFLAANPYWLGLPGTGILDGFTVFIAAYIPASILVGATLSWLAEIKITTSTRLSRIGVILSLLATILILCAGLWGTRQRLNDVQPLKHALAGHPDILAAYWLQENIPSQARLLVNSFPAFGNSVIVGSDGGWWLPLLAHRLTTLPPINYGFERDPRSGYRNQINELTFEIGKKGVDHPDILSELKKRDISYVYIGQRQGNVNSGGPLLIVDQLLADPIFQLIYHQDRVWIFRIQQAP